VEINTQRLLIRNLATADLEDFYVYRSNPGVTKYQGFDVMNRKQAKTFIENQMIKNFGIPGDWVQYAITIKERDKLIGDCAIRLLEEDIRIAENGITISPEYQRNGYAKEAMLGIMKWLFEEKKVHRIVEVVDVENLGSIKLMESLNFRREAYFVENIFFNGKWGSEYLYAMLEREWQNRLK